MMYSQQEYEMFRRQMMQIEAEKRAVLRYALVLVIMLFAGSLGLLGWIYAGFSTAEKVTTISGRGVGMDVVRKQISKLKGLIDI